MAKKIIAIAFSDIHYANWKQFNKDNYRLDWNDKILRRICKEAHKNKVPILFSGDLVDHPRYIENTLLERLSNTLTNSLKTNFYGIEGNHDQPTMNSFKKPVKGYLHSLTRLKTEGEIRVINNSSQVTRNFKVHGIPYILGNIDFMDSLVERINDIDPSIPNILLVHRDLDGAVEPNGVRVDKEKAEDKKLLKKYFSKFDLVLSGHIHKPQPIKNLGNNVFMLGSTHQQRRSDMGCKMGYWEIYQDTITETLEMVFKPLKTPEFKFYEGESPEDDFHFWIKSPTPRKSNTEETKEFSITETSREKMVKNYLTLTNQKKKKLLNLALKYI